jgi:acyl-CoA thioesterase-2
MAFGRVSNVRIECELLEPVLRLELAGVDVFRCNVLSPNMYHRIFGGQLLANALAAAMMTVPQRPPHVLQAFFLRPGLMDAPLELRVERVRDGARFSHRHVDVYQSAKRILSAEVSFHDGGSGPEHQREPPTQVQAPECLQELSEIVAALGEAVLPGVRERMLAKSSMLVRPVDADAGITRAADLPQLMAWMKPARPLPAEPLLAFPALAFLSDYWLAASCRTPHAKSIFDEGTALTSLNHSIWFHHEPVTDDWLLYDMESPIARNSLGLARGFFYRRDGQMLASCIQQTLMSQ